jgi:hypothetical protein
MPRCRNCSRETMARHVTGGDPCWYCPQFMRSLVLSFAVGNADAVATIKANAAQHAADLRGIVDDIRRSGITTVRGIAEELHNRGIRAPRGDTWHPTAVARLLNRLGNATQTS